MTRKKSSKLNEEEVLRHHSEGLSQKDIGEIFGVGKSTINNILKKFNLTSGQSEIDVSEVLRRHSEGESNIEIANAMNHSRSNIFRIIKENNLTPNKSKIKNYTKRVYDPTKEELENDLKSKSKAQIARENNVSATTVGKRMIVFGLV